MEKRIKLLGIETSTNHCSVALFEDGKAIATRLLTEEGSHSKMLTLLIQEVCKETQTNLAELAGIAVSIGPGSYTGLRIGLSTAKGLCYGNDLPLLAIPTLSIMAEAAREKHSNKWLCPMLDARRMEVYTCLFNEKGQAQNNPQAVILHEDYLTDYSAPIVVFGNGSHKWKAQCTGKHLIFDDAFDFPNAIHMGRLAHAQFLNKSFENLVTLEPQYLKEFMGTQPKKLV